MVLTIQWTISEIIALCSIQPFPYTSARAAVVGALWTLFMYVPQVRLERHVFFAFFLDTNAHESSHPATLAFYLMHKKPALLPGLATSCNG